MKLYDGGIYLVNESEIVADNADAAAILSGKTGNTPDKEEARKGTLAYNILKDHNTSGNMDELQIKFDKLTSHDYRNSRFHMCLQTVITVFAQSVEPSTRMTTCLDSPVQRNMAESMYHLIRQSFISSPEKCWPAAER